MTKTIRSPRLPALLGVLIASVLAIAGCTAAAPPAPRSNESPATQSNASPSRQGKASAATQGKELYLTFDDGPGTETGHILDVLKENNAKAVFFTIGKNLGSHRDLARRAIAEGNVVANHTWDHQSLTKLDLESVDSTLDKATAALRAIGSTSPCIRPPYGATNERIDARIKDKGLHRVLWTVDTEDWRKPGAQLIADRLVDRASPGAVVLMHDGGGDRSETVQALRIALPKLAAQGYTFTTVRGC